MDELGADSFRLYEMFMGAFDQPIPWNTSGARGCRRFLERVWKLQDMVQGEGDTDADLRRSVHACIKKVGEDYERMKYNTAIAAMMSLVNDFYDKGRLTRDELHTLLLLLNPVAPQHHRGDERAPGLCPAAPQRLARLRREPRCWPLRWSTACRSTARLRARITLPADLDKAGVEQAALAAAEVQPFLAGKAVRKVIVVRNIVNIVVA